MTMSNLNLQNHSSSPGLFVELVGDNIRADELIPFRALFEGNDQAWGADHGESIKREVTAQHWIDHLEGVTPLGIYPIREGKVKWGCSDIDVDNIQLAKNLQLALSEVGIKGWIERSRSKGFHVWVFCTEWVLAKDMRHALLAAHQAADVPPTEVNPKQEELAPGQLGNYVRLPYGGALRAPSERQVILKPDDTPMSLKQFLTEATQHRTTPAQIQAVASLYVKPKPPLVYPNKVKRPAPEKLNKLGKHIFRYGPNDGDRSNTLAKLAHCCRESGLDTSECYAILVEADDNWGDAGRKFTGRRDAEQRYWELVRKVYG